MKTIDQKHQILESLDTLDQNQTEKVLNYINDLINVSREDVRYQRLKREAIKEIRQALSNGRKLSAAF
jgi:signal transduction histidine kinase